MRARWNRTALGGLVLVTCLASLGCGSSATRPRYDDEAVLFGYLYVGEAITAENALRVSRTRPVQDYYDPTDATVNDAVVLLRAEGATLVDTLRWVAPGRYANPAVVVAESTTYQLTVTFAGRTVSATTRTPRAFSVLQEPLIVPATMPHAAISETYPVVLNGADPTQIILVDTYCLEPFQNARYVNPIGSRDTPADFDEYGGTNGAPRHSQFIFRLEDLPEVSGGYRIGFYGDMMQFYGEHALGLFAIDANYYNYLYRDNPERTSGVTGGVGVFGSASRRTYRVKTTP